MKTIRALCLILALLLCCGAAGAEEYTLPGTEFAPGWDTVDNNRVFYEIFVGSFSDSDGDGIGDLRGILNRMDYLNDGDPASGKSLGVEGLWLTPIFLSPSYHKYDVTDYYRIDPAFGTEEDLRELCRVCHERGVLVILDLPINHTGSECIWFQRFKNAHLMHNPRNTYYDFFVWATPGDVLPAGRHFAPVQGQQLLVEANFSDSMPEPDFDLEMVRETFLDVARHWLDVGVDGFRFDAAKYIYLGDNPRSVAFWEWYLDELRKIKPDIYTVGEVWDGDGVIAQYLPAMPCFQFSSSQADGIFAETAKGGDANRFAAWLERTQQAMNGVRPTFFLSNHDMDRAAGYLTVASGRMAVAANLYLLTPGSPFLYYGEEIGLRGSRGGSNTDANRRLAMLWDDGDTVASPEGATYAADKQTPYGAQKLLTFPTGLVNHYKRVIQVRKANPEIARGTVTALSFPDTKLGGFLSTWEGSTVAVLHNTTQRTLSVDLAAAGVPLTRVAAVLSADIEGYATLEGTVLTVSGQTSVVVR